MNLVVDASVLIKVRLPAKPDTNNSLSFQVTDQEPLFTRDLTPDFLSGTIRITWSDSLRWAVFTAQKPERFSAANAHECTPIKSGRAVSRNDATAQRKVLAGAAN